MPGYKHLCRYCDKLIPPDSNVCPLCGKINPHGELRCPKCRNPIQKDWKKCNHCGLSLEIACIKCGKITFFGDYCEHCNVRLAVVCPNKKCKTEQPPIGEKCLKCGKALK
ncbi:MAG: zinc ribbon domain-containing protein [Thermoplasmata archaeon]